MDQGNWYNDHIKTAVYADPVEEAVCTAIQRALIKTFGLFKWQLDDNGSRSQYFPKLPLLHQTCIYKVIDSIKNEIARHNLEYCSETEELQQSGVNVESRNIITDRLQDVWAWISTGFLAQLVLNLTSTFAVCKNWNSHGTLVGASVCQLGAVPGSLEKGAVGPLINTEFQQVIPIGNVLTRNTLTL